MSKVSLASALRTFTSLSLSFSGIYAQIYNNKNWEKKKICGLYFGAAFSPEVKDGTSQMWMSARSRKKSYAKPPLAGGLSRSVTEAFPSWLLISQGSQSTNWPIIPRLKTSWSPLMRH